MPNPYSNSPFIKEKKSKIIFAIKETELMLGKEGDTGVVIHRLIP